MTNAITLLNTEETYRNLQPFSTVEELNTNTSAIRDQFGDQMTPATREVLDALHRYACKYPGVSYRSKSKIAAELGITRRTVIRACNALEAMGVIKQYELKRHNGDKRQSSNAIVFVAVQKAEVTPECHTKETPANTQKILTNTLDTKNAVSVDKSTVKESVKESGSAEVKSNIKRGLRDKMPSYLYDLLAPYFSLEGLYEAYGALIRGKASVDRDITFESNEGLFSDAVLSVINAYKRGVVRNLNAVLYSAASETTAQIYRKENYTAPNWLAW